MYTKLDLFSWFIILFVILLMAWAAVYYLGAAVDWQGLAALVRAVRG